jgi:hypothetical protein
VLQTLVHFCWKWNFGPSKKSESNKARPGPFLPFLGHEVRAEFRCSTAPCSTTTDVWARGALGPHVSCSTAPGPRPTKSPPTEVPRLSPSRVPHQLQFLLHLRHRRRDFARSSSSPARHGDAEPYAALPQVPRRAAARPRAVQRSGRQRRRRRPGDRDVLAAASRPHLRLPQHRRPLRLQVPHHPLPCVPGFTYTANRNARSRKVLCQ